MIIQCQWLFLSALLFVSAFANAEEKQDREATPAVVHAAVRSELRPTLSLDGPWDFCTDPKLEGESQAWFQQGKPLPNARQLQVPGCWEAQGIGEPALSQAGNKLAYEPVNVKLKHAYTGAAWYKKEFVVPQDWAGKQIWLKVGGVNSQGWFWVNGHYVGRDWSYCGSWKYNVTDLAAPGQKATIAVLVRNDVPSRRGESNCVRMYGGVFRSVELEATPAIAIDNAYVEPLFDQKKARVHVTLRNAASVVSGDKYALQVKVAAVSDSQAAGEVAATIALVAGPTTEWTVDVNLDPFRPWSPESPSLYRAKVVLKQGEKPIDGWAERFGMKKFEVRGGDYYLNNVRYYLRNCGDDHVYPETVCSPASREEHAKHLRMMREYGFNYIRLHTHCEVPEYFEAADEVGMMIQPELPYYGKFNEQRPYSHLSGAPLTPKEDLRELVAHMRRYASLAIYCGGNEGHSPTPLNQELYKLAKTLDPSRPWLNMDGAQNNTKENSEVDHGGYGWQYVPQQDTSWPFVRHEYMSFGINEDPRLEAKYSSAFAPNMKLQDTKRMVTEQLGLDWHWAEACLDAGHRLQGIWHKIGLEAARIDPFLDGFSCWLMVDLSPSTQCGVLDMFWGKKWSTPEYFRQFNAPTVVLAKTVGSAQSPDWFGFSPATLIYTAGDALELDWVVSHFQPEPLKNAALVWRIVDGEKTLAEGKIEKIDVAAGTVPTVGRSRITMPSVGKAVRASLVAEVAAAQTRNSWDLWIFPKFAPKPESGKRMAASAGAFDLLMPRYPGLAKLGTAEAATAAIVVARDFCEAGVLDALKQGKSVVCLSLPGYNLLRPGTGLAAWQISNQTGTAIAAHPAFGDFPNGGYLDQGWFRLVDKAEKLDPGHKFRTVEPLMIGIGRETGYAFGTLGYPLGFNLYAFQARAGQGKLLATGLNLMSDNPEAVYLLDQFVRYARSEKFNPQGTFDLAELDEPRTEDVAFTAKCDGSTQRYVVVYPNGFRADQPVNVLVALHGHGSDRWQFVKDPRDECRAARDAAAARGMLFVSPDYRAKTSWMGPKAEADMLQILEELKTKYKVGKVIVSGGSMGGTSALTFAALHPELVAGVVALNGTANHVEYDKFQDAIQESFGGTKAQVPQEYENRSAELRAERLTMPVGITAGGKDDIVPPTSVLRLGDKLKKTDRKVLVIYREACGHSTNYEDARAVFAYVLEQAVR